MTPFSAIITPESVSFTSPDGRVTNIDSSHKNWEKILDGIRELQRETRADPLSPAVAELHDKLSELADAGNAKGINAAGHGRVVVKQGVVYYDDEPIRSAITDRIIWGLSEGFDMLPYMRFLDNAMDNPSARAVDEMYGFMEKHNMGITDDGYILGYKKIRENFTDIWSGKFDNSPGQTIKMRRNQVDDNPTRTCSKGLHFCSMAYLPHFGSGPGHRIIIVKVNPRDIVSVPLDYNHAKVRCCEYTVLSEYTGDDKDDLLGSKAVWSDEDFEDHEWDDEEDDDQWDEEDGVMSSPAMETDVTDLSDEDFIDRLTTNTETKVEPAVEDNFGLSPFDIAKFYTASEESKPVPLSEEGGDMRQIMDTIESPSTDDGEAMRELIDVVVDHMDPPPATIEQLKPTPEQMSALRNMLVAFNPPEEGNEPKE